MSNDINSGLLEEATEYINSGDLSSTLLEKALEEDIRTGDMTALWHHVVAARDMLREEVAEYDEVY